MDAYLWMHIFLWILRLIYSFVEWIKVKCSQLERSRAQEENAVYNCKWIANENDYAGALALLVQ